MSAATVHGTGTGAVFVQRPSLPKTEAGFYLRHREGGLVAHITATQDTLSTLRALARSVLLFYGTTTDHADSAQLVLSVLVGNSIRACGEHHVPLVIEVYTTAADVTVSVHDPVPELLPRRSEASMDSDQAVGGRGLALLDVLTPGWSIESSPVGKTIRCHLA